MLARGRMFLSSMAMSSPACIGHLASPDMLPPYHPNLKYHRTSSNLGSNKSSPLYNLQVAIYQAHLIYGIMPSLITVLTVRQRSPNILHNTQYTSSVSWLLGKR